jgi:cobalt-zinc-cadmium efflux system outer membrane protein
LEVAGQSVLRVEVADGELRAQGHRVALTRRDVAAQAWSAYFIVLAVQERLRLAAKLEHATATVATTVRAMATNGLTSDVDADIAETAALRATSDRLALESRLVGAKAQLNRVVGGRPEVAVEGVLDPLRLPAEQAPLEQQPALLALHELQHAARRRVDLVRRERIPNPTVSLLAQNDGFDERVLGVGVSVPIPLPQPIGRTRAGQVAEASALAERIPAEAERLKRELQAELLSANAEFEAASKTRLLYPPERVQRAAARLETIAQQVKAARLSVRDALLAQQALIEQLKAEIEAREAVCIASVRLARAAGTSLEGDAL